MHEDELTLLRSAFLHSRPPGALVEIGTGAGGTLSCLLAALPTDTLPPVVVVDPMTYFDNQLNVVKRNLLAHGIDPANVDFRIHRSDDALAPALLAGETIAFLIIDGSHALLDVMCDLQWTRLLRAGGVVCLHDYSEQFPGVQRAVDRFLRRNAGGFGLTARARSLVVLQKLSHKETPEFGMVDWAVAAIAQSLRSIARWTGRTLRHHRRVLARRWPHAYQDAIEAYLQREFRHLGRDQSHPTLGSKPTLSGRPFFEALLASGLLRHHRVVDFGCGSLRIGHYLIDYLDQGQYWGLDVTDRFITMGLDLWYADRPLPCRTAWCGLISPRVLEEVEAESPDLVLLSGVLHCVQQRHLRQLLGQVSSVCSPGTQVIATLLEAKRSTRAGSASSRHPLEDVRSAARQVGLELAVLHAGRESELMSLPEDPDGTADRATVLLLARSLKAARAGALRLHEAGLLGGTRA